MREAADAAHRVDNGAEQGLDADGERARGDIVFIAEAGARDMVPPVDNLRAFSV